MRFFVASLAAAAVLVPVLADEVKIEVTFLPTGCTQKTKNGDMIYVSYNGTFTNGTAFDSSYDKAGKSTPINFALGAGRVIPGWEQGLLSMCVGERRKLTIPPSLAYGDRRNGPIPPNSTLVFGTELASIQGFPQPHHD